MKIFYHLLDSAIFNSWILYKTSKKTKSIWNVASRRKHTLAWFKESVILSLCGTFTSRKQAPSVKLSNPALPIQTVLAATAHQIQPVSQIRGIESTRARCFKCDTLKRTACAVCKVPYCYQCGHLQDMLLQHTASSSAIEDSDQEDI